MKIAIAGTGYVCLSNAILLAQQHQVVALDIVPAKVYMLNRKQSPIEDADIKHYLQQAYFYHSKVVNDLAAFKQKASVIIANRQTDALSDVADKVYARDLFGVYA